MDWTKVKDENPKNNLDGILAANVYNGDFLWIASLWYDDEFDEWNCDFTDEEFKNINYRAFTHWMPLPEPPKII